MNKIKKVISLGIALLASVVFFSIFAGSEARAAANINIDSAKINSSNTVLVKFADPGGNLASVDATKWHIDVGGGGMTPLTPSNAAVTSAGTSWTVTLTFTGTSFSNKAKMYSATEGLYADASAVTDMNGDTNTVVSQTDSIAIADGQAPTLTIGLSDDSLTKNQTALVSFVFSEETAGFDANDVTVQNGTLGTIDSSNPLVQLATFTPTADTTDATNVISVATSWQDKNGNAPAGTISSANYSVLTNDQNGGDEGTNPPTSASISINAGAVTTSSLDVSLTLAATGATQMLISNNSGFSGASWMSLATSKSWTLTSGDGVKTVYAKFKSGSGGVSSAVSDTITVSGSGTNAGVPSDDTAGGCSAGNLFNIANGQLCVNNAGPQIPGCGNRTTGFSAATGQSCLLNRVTASSGDSSTGGVQQGEDQQGKGKGPAKHNFGNSILKNGSRGEAAKELQRFLNEVLKLGLVVDGKIGPKTIAVIKKWQADRGLVADGLVGPSTKAKMHEEEGD